MLGRLFKRRPYTLGRARALTAQYLRQYRDAMASRVHAWDSPGPIEENGPDRTPDMPGPDRQTAADRYVAYAVFLAAHAYGRCSPLLPETDDEDEGINFIVTALAAGLGLDLAVARDLFVAALDEAPRNDDGRLLDDDDFDGLQDRKRRSFMLWNIAIEDAAVVVRAFADGRTSIDPSGHDFEPLAEWLSPPAE